MVTENRSKGGFERRVIRLERGEKWGATGFDVGTYTVYDIH